MRQAGMLREPWQKYLEDPETVDEGEFTPLLTDIEEIVTPEEAFSSFAGGAEMAKRCRELMEKSLFNGLYYVPDPANARSTEQLKSWAEDTIASMYDLLREENEREAAKALSGLPWKSTCDMAQFQDLTSSSYQNRAISEAGRKRNRAISKRDERLFGAREAVLGLTMDWYVTDYILSAVVPFPINYRPGFDIFIGGGQLAVLHDKILLYVPQDVRPSDHTSI